MSNMPTLNPSFGDLYLFIYQVRPRLSVHDDVVETRFCSVLVAGGDASRAEEIAISRVHQNGWRILRTDTSARLSADQVLGYKECAAQLEELRRYGSALWVS
jgi:hypothetical protein